MKQNKVKKMMGTMAVVMIAAGLLAGCGNREEGTSETPAQSQMADDNAFLSSTSGNEEEGEESESNTTEMENTQGDSSESGNAETDTADGETEEISSGVDLEVRFGDAGEPFAMHMENNETADAIVRYVGTSDWRLPIYDRDDSVDYSVLEYYDIPSRYEIPSSPETVTQAHAGDVFYSDPNRIVLYYRDAEISEEYVKIGTFDATEEFISAVENNPVLEGWGNKIIQIAQP